MTATALRICQCPQPEPQVNREGVCVKCGYSLSDEWGDEGVQAFYDALAEAHPGGPPTTFDYFRLEAESRERVGRRTFRLSCLSRDNIRDAFQEATDGSNYIMFRVWQNRRAGHDDQMDLAMSAAYHFARAYHYAALMREDDKGMPHAISDTPEP